MEAAAWCWRGGQLVHSQLELQSTPEGCWKPHQELTVLGT